MKHFGVFVITGLIIASASPRTVARTNKRVPVYVSVYCDNDTVGQRIGYQVREGLRSSSSMELATTYLGSVAQVRLVCLDPNVQDQGNVSGYSYVYTILNAKGTYDFYLTSGVGRCGSARVHDCAMDIVSGLDATLTKLIEHANESSHDQQHP